MSAMPVMIAVLCLMAIAYRYYSAFLAARVATLDDSRRTPAYEREDGHNFHPTSKWVLFGHHFAAISGAGPLIGPVLAAQFGYLPGLLWIVIGVCLAGAVQDFLVLSASIRRGGRSLAQIAYSDIGKVAGVTGTIAILLIIVVALAGLGKVVVKALGGETVSYAGMRLTVNEHVDQSDGIYQIPAGSSLQLPGSTNETVLNEPFKLRGLNPPIPLDLATGFSLVLPTGAVRLMPGSSWGTFTIACTIPIALFVGLYMYKLRPGKVVEASLIGGALTIAATVLGGLVPESRIAPFFNLSANGVTWSMAIYGFIAAVLPVWVLLAPRDYLSSFLKIGTIVLLVVGTLIANPKFEAPALNTAFWGSGPTLGPRPIFPFLFITIMCGAISGFHALVSSGTTPKMIRKESDARTIGYGAMLIEGLVGVVAMIAATTLPVNDYYAMNTELAAMPKYHDRILAVAGPHGVEDIGMYEDLTKESLRGRTGGAVTLAVGMAHIFDSAARKFSSGAETSLRAFWKYWYHFAIMFEALFILTTIDAGTRIGRFLLQEVAGKIHPKLGITGGWIPAMISTAIIVFAWAWFMNSDSFATIWAMFGVANQMLAVIALAIVSAYLANIGKARYLWVTVLPMLFVMTTTSTAAVQLFLGQVDGIRVQWGNGTPFFQNNVLVNAIIEAACIAAMMVSGFVVIITAGMRVWKSTNGLKNEARGFEVVMGK
ncbi:MAG TPA: carbon starvation protein A [Tepidisphaeraceae bacterium]|jgi:carbon starvation protein|nr:carbon starvation protein A [Tepidisphaeraceae bacterium]